MSGVKGTKPAGQGTSDALLPKPCVAGSIPAGGTSSLGLPDAGHISPEFHATRVRHSGRARVGAGRAVTLSRDRNRCLADGANAVMTKPFGPRDVADAVAELLSMQTGVLQS